MDLFDADLYYDYNDPEQLEKIRQQPDAPTIIMTIILIAILILYTTCVPFEKME
jgi:hypothetical protein